jgi:hypothetical protein
MPSFAATITIAPITTRYVVATDRASRVTVNSSTVSDRAAHSEARSVPLASFGRKPSDAPAVRWHNAAAGGATLSVWLSTFDLHGVETTLKPALTSLLLG